MMSPLLNHSPTNKIHHIWFTITDFHAHLNDVICINPHYLAKKPSCSDYAWKRIWRRQACFEVEQRWWARTFLQNHISLHSHFFEFTYICTHTSLDSHVFSFTLNFIYTHIFRTQIFSDLHFFALTFLRIHILFSHIYMNSNFDFLVHTFLCTHISVWLRMFSIGVIGLLVLIIPL